MTKIINSLGFKLMKAVRNGGAKVENSYFDYEINLMIKNYKINYEKLNDSVKTNNINDNEEEKMKVLILYYSNKRNKRYLFVYHAERLSEILQGIKDEKRGKRIEWNLGPKFEIKAYEDYKILIDELAEEFNDLDLFLGEKTPPTNIYTIVEVLEDLGEIQMGFGPIFLKKNTIHHLKRKDVKHLISLGYLREII